MKITDFKDENYYEKFLIYLNENNLSIDIYLNDLEILGLLFSSNEGIRTFLADNIPYMKKTSKALSYLLYLANDEEDIVKGYALDSLSYFECKASYEMFLKYLNYSDEFVRSYAVYGISYVGTVLYPEEAKKILIEAIKQESNESIIIRALIGLYLLEEISINEILDLFDSADLKAKIQILNFCSYHVDKNNHLIIKEFLSKLNSSDYLISVKEIIERTKKNVRNECF